MSVLRDSEFYKQRPFNFWLAGFMKEKFSTAVCYNKYGPYTQFENLCEWTRIFWVSVKEVSVCLFDICCLSVEQPDCSKPKSPIIGTVSSRSCNSLIQWHTNFQFEPVNRAVLHLLAHQILIISHEWWTSCYKENCNAYCANYCHGIPIIDNCTFVIDPSYRHSVRFCM